MWRTARGIGLHLLTIPAEFLEGFHRHKFFGHLSFANSTHLSLMGALLEVTATSASIQHRDYYQA